MDQSSKNLSINQKWIQLPHLASLIGNKPLEDRHLLKQSSLSEEDLQIVNEALGIMRQKIQVSGKPEKKLCGDVRDPAKFVGLLGELFWCHRLTQLDYTFKTESKNGGPDFRIDLGKRTVYADVKTFLKEIGSNEQSAPIASLMKTIDGMSKDCPDIFRISVRIGYNFSHKTIKPLAAKIQKSLQKISISQKEDTFNYPVGTYGYSCEAEVTIARSIREKTAIFIQRPAMLLNDDDLLERALNKARKQFNKNDINIVFIDNTFRAILEDEDIRNVLCRFYRNNSRISAVVVYRRNGMLDIQDANVYPHPESCKLTVREIEALKRLSGC